MAAKEQSSVVVLAPWVKSVAGERAPEPGLTVRLCEMLIQATTAALPAWTSLPSSIRLHPQRC